MNTTEEKAVRAIIKAEASRRTYRTLNEILGKSRSTLMQVDVLLDPNNP
jgi:hypothetical protein